MGLGRGGEKLPGSAQGTMALFPARNPWERGVVLGTVQGGAQVEMAPGR